MALPKDMRLKGYRTFDYIHKINNHKPYWLLVNLKIGDFCNDKSRLLEEFQNLMFKSRLIK